MARPLFSLVVRTTGRLAAVYGVLMALVLYTPVTDWFAYKLLPGAGPPAGDVIVVLSAWANAAGELNEPGLRRAIAAASLYRGGTASAVVVSGRRPMAGDGDSVRAIATLLEELGVPAAAITIEDRSVNTHASAVNVSTLAREHQWSKLVVVTDATHMLRARLAFEHEGMRVSPFPSMMWMIGGETPTVRLAKLGAVAHEYGGLLYYWARGWI